MRKIILISILTLQLMSVCYGQNLYFPQGCFIDTITLANGTTKIVGTDEYRNKWYSKHLYAMQEPLIYNDTSHNEIYRFTWLRTFHNPVSIRIEKQGDNYMLYWKLCNGAGGYDSGILTINKQKVIDKQTWETFKLKLLECDFWHLPILIQNGGLDGSQWILEGKNSDNNYHVVDRWSPIYTKKSKFYECCNFLIMQTDLKIRGNKKY